MRILTRQRQFLDKADLSFFLPRKNERRNNNDSVKCDSKNTQNELRALLVFDRVRRTAHRFILKKNRLDRQFCLKKSRFLATMLSFGQPLRIK